MVFISSRQDPKDSKMSRARELVIKEVANYPGMKVWAFEDAPASSEVARDRYIRNAERADIVIWLIGSSTTDPIVEEISACKRTQGRLLAFKLPADERDVKTEALIKDVSDYATWKTVENAEELPAHINAALTDEVLRRFRDPAPVNHDLFLKQKYRESIADTKRLWTTLGVTDIISSELAEDHEVGNKLTLPTEGTLTVNARQGSGKTLAAQRLYQQALNNRIKDHSQPFPIFLNARSISGELKDQIERHSRDQGSVYTQKVMVIIDGLDETGRHKANQLLDQARSYTEANRNVAVVLMTRPLPGLKLAEEPLVLPGCDEKELLSIASKIAGREVHWSEIPFRELQSRLPLFAAIVGIYLRQPMPVLGRTPSQKASEIIRRILDDSDHYPADTEEFLKKLAIASTISGESVERATVALRTSDQARLAESRIVVEEGGKFDFTLAIFREWFAARAIVEGSVTLEDIELNSDRWVVPLAIAINSENPNTGPEIMEKLASKDPGMAGLVLDEVKHNWSTDESTESELRGTAMEIGTSIKNAIENWKEGLGSLMPALNMLDKAGNVPTLGIDTRAGWVTTSWYRGDEEFPPVVQLPEDLHDSTKGHFWNWPGWHSRSIEPTRVWPWSVAHDEISQLLSTKLSSKQLAHESQDGFHEFAYELSSYLRRSYFRAREIQTPNDITDFIERELLKYGGDPRTSVTFGYSEYALTLQGLEIFREKVSELSRNGRNILVDPWPGPDRELTVLRVNEMRYEPYTDERLLERTNAVYNAALRIYNDIVDRWFYPFKKRGQMSHALPFRMRGELQFLRDRHQGWHNASLAYWIEQAYSEQDSGVFIELEPKGQTSGDEIINQRLPRHSGLQILPVHRARPATELAHRWLQDDLHALHWASRANW